MTNEEAIRTLKEHKITFQHDFGWNTSTLEAIEMAIKALEQEPCEDCISRKAVLDYIDKMPSELTADGRRMIRRRTLEEYISDTLPPVTPKPKTGHWILQPSNKEQGERDFIWWKCSECGQVIFSETTHDRLEFHAFCSRCGAKMIEPQESEEQE